MNYQAPWYLPNKHLQTIFPALFRRVKGLHYQRERITTPDGDFLDLDWISLTGQDPGPANTLLIMSHGLEGDSSRSYIKGMARAFLLKGCHALAWNYRGCSGESNKLPHFYHSGATHDLAAVIQHVLQKHSYERIILVGFSLGGNLTLKWVGECGNSLPKQVWKALGISVPLDLAGSSRQIGLPENKVYEQRFLKNLRRKLILKWQLQPQAYDLKPLDTIKSLWEFDEYYTAPLHGFKGAAEYYARCSALNFLQDISIPTLILNAKNDPFLSAGCFPRAIMQGQQPFIQLEAPQEGGHVGFPQAGAMSYAEKRALGFVFDT